MDANPESHLRNVLMEQNQWHETARVPAVLAPETERPLARRLWRRLLSDDPRRYQLILGPRRVGKTTVLYQTVRRLLSEGVEPRRLWWLRLDHPVLMQASLGDLVRYTVTAGGATPERPIYLMLDELAYAEKWDLWLKTFYDEAWPVRIAATSSATAVLRKRRLESGVGRWEEQQLAPYLFSEFLELADHTPAVAAAESLVETVEDLPEGRSADPPKPEFLLLYSVTGGFPELLVRALSSQGPDGEPPSLPDAVLRSQRYLREDAIERAVYKDIPQSFQIENPLLLERLLYLLAGQVAQVLSPQNVASDLGVSVPTLQRYLSYLQSAFLVFTLPVFAGKESTTQRRGRKLYFVDSEVRNAALHRGIAPLNDPVEMGHLTENLAVSSIRTLAEESGVRLYYWRQRQRDEIDLVYDDPRGPLAFEIASSSNHDRRGMRAFIRAHPDFAGRTYLVAPQCLVHHAGNATDGIGTLPLDTFLIAVGAQHDRAMANRLR